MRVLITGGTGFLGSALWPLLVDRGHEVLLLQRGPASRLAQEKTKVLSGSLGDARTARRALEGVDAVYHLAGRVSRDPRDARSMYELHVEGTRVLVEEAHRQGVKRFVLASTSGTIGVSKTDRIATEDDDYPIEVVGRWPYYTSKIYEEKLALSFCRERQLPLVVLNPSLLLGPGDERLSSTQDVLRFLNRDIPSMPHGGLSFVDVRDAAEAFANALDRGVLYERHLLGGANMALDEFFKRLSRIADVPPPPLRLPGTLAILGAHALEKLARYRKTEPNLDPQSVEMGEHFFYIDSSKARRELGFAPRDPQETLASTVHYLRRQMPEVKSAAYRS